MLTQYQACVRWPVQCCAWLCHPQDYLLISVCLGQPSVERLRKLLHPVGKCRIIDTVLHAAESHLGWDTVLQHRSYKETAGSVGIAIYDNRVKIENPGTFPSNWDTEMKSEHESKPQNPLLVNVLYKQKVLESWGRGIGLMMSECRKAGLPEPEYKIWADNAASRCV